MLVLGERAARRVHVLKTNIPNLKTNGRGLAQEDRRFLRHPSATTALPAGSEAAGDAYAASLLGPVKNKQVCSWRVSHAVRECGRTCDCMG